jgi:hypothetical protein
MLEEVIMPTFIETVLNLPDITSTYRTVPMFVITDLQTIFSFISSPTDLVLL